MAQGGLTLESQFVLFSKFGDTKSDGKTITLTQIDKWLKQAHVIDKKITTTDTGIAFNKFKSKTIGLGDFNKFIDDLGNQKGIPPAELKAKLVECGLPGTTKTTATSHAGGVDRLTDTSQYTGTHKERFDAEGKGKGKEGRENVVADDGYVADYKGKGTYDKK